MTNRRSADDGRPACVRAEGGPAPGREASPASRFETGGATLFVVKETATARDGRGARPEGGRSGVSVPRPVRPSGGSGWHSGLMLALLGAACFLAAAPAPRNTDRAAPPPHTGRQASRESGSAALSRFGAPPDRPAGLAYGARSERDAGILPDSVVIVDEYGEPFGRVVVSYTESSLPTVASDPDSDTVQLVRNPGGETVATVRSFEFIPLTPATSSCDDPYR